MTDQGQAVDFIVNRADLHACRFVPSPSVDPADGALLVAVDRFAFTANNVTYGVVGEMMSYWKFFPAEEGWGRIPVWGFGNVLRSRHPDVAEGERLFGYFPMSTHVVLQGGTVTPSTITDGSAHRQPLPPIYNQYQRVAHDPLYTADTEDWQMLFRPLFMTAFLLDDFLGEAGLFGAEAVVLTSASSKTALSLASLLSRNQRAPGRVIGLTSDRNVAFVEGVGCYDRVVRYDDIASLPTDRPVVTVDMAGNGQVLEALHRRFGAGLKFSSLVGLTHWDRGERADDLPGATPTFFFAPDQAQKRAQELGAATLGERMASAWHGFVTASASWIRVTHGKGQAAVERVYRATLDGQSDPAHGNILSLG